MLLKLLLIGHVGVPGGNQVGEEEGGAQGLGEVLFVLDGEPGGLGDGSVDCV